MSVRLALLGLLASTGAWAAPRCVPLDRAAFGSALIDAQVAADRGEVGLHASIVDDVRERVPCLEFAPSRRLWAEFLASWALAEFARQGDWKAPLGAALQLRPEVDRGVGGYHPMASFEAPPPTEDHGPQVPADAVVWVDGERSGFLPAPGVHLVQREVDGAWDSVLTTGDQVDPDWLDAPIHRAPTVAWWGTVGATLGGGAVAQRTSWLLPPDGVSYTPERTLGRALLGLSGRMMATYGGFGVLGEAGMAAANGQRPADGWAQGAVVGGVRGVALGAGIGLAAATVVEGELFEDEPEWHEREIAAPYGVLVGLVRRGRWDGGLSGGLGPSTGRGAMHAGLSSEGGTRVGLLGSWQRVLVTPGGRENLDAHTTTWKVAVEVGLKREGP